MATALDPKDFRVGRLVQRSEAWLVAVDGRNEDQLGIIVDVTIEEESGLAWPDVHWEGNETASYEHPSNVDLVDRTGLRIQYSDG